MAIDGDPGHLLGISGGQPGEPSDVAGLTADGIHAAHDGVVDCRRVDVVAVEDAPERVPTEVDRMDTRQ